ncbi:LysR substrate-binding domain-containing protein, partial [Marichromatium gracile]|uniref:LysR substrate-binding domain-containing protein n=1 Tax=Marichromatium gracile TaxID=1048 RepID=UPI0012905999
MTTLRQMRFLVALADTGNFSRAAEQCHVTQSTLSTGLKEMESRLGVRVAERTTHAVIMTPVGAALANRARQILASVGDFEEMARAAANESALHIRLGTIPTVGPFLLPRALPILRKTWPRLKVYLREELTDALVSGLQDGRLDVILLALPHGLPENIETEILFDDGYKMALPRDHPLANLEKIEGPDLAGRDLLLLERGHCLQNHALSSVPGVVLSEDASFSATSLPTLVSMVEEGLGVTLLPRLATDAGLTAAHDINLSELAHA